MSLKASDKHLSLLMIGFLAYMGLPFVFWTWLLCELESGSFPPEADSIGIPLGGFLLIWGVGLFFGFVLSAIYVGRGLTNATRDI